MRQTEQDQQDQQEQGPQAIFSVEEVAQKLRVSNDSIRRAIIAGGIRGVRVGGVYRITRSDLELYLGATLEDLGL